MCGTYIKRWNKTSIIKCYFYLLVNITSDQLFMEYIEYGEQTIKYK
jgi:hypothetical protein